MPVVSVPPLPSGWMSLKTNVRTKSVKEAMDGQVFGHKTIPNPIYPYARGVKHTLGTKSTAALERLMRSPGDLSAMLSRGDCKPDTVKADKKHYADKAWHIKQRLVIDGVPYRLDAVVLHHIPMGKNILYDVTLTETKK
jgi:hypothetical protein